jgi:hypothetical protein
VRIPGVTPRAGTETLGGARTGSVPCLLLRCLRLAVQQREDASVTPPREAAPRGARVRPKDMGAAESKVACSLARN